MKKGPPNDKRHIRTTSKSHLSWGLFCQFHAIISCVGLSVCVRLRLISISDSYLPSRIVDVAVVVVCRRFETRVTHLVIAGVSSSQSSRPFREKPPPPNLMMVVTGYKEKPPRTNKNFFFGGFLLSSRLNLHEMLKFVLSHGYYRNIWAKWDRFFVLGMGNPLCSLMLRGILSIILRTELEIWLRPEACEISWEIFFPNGAHSNKTHPRWLLRLATLSKPWPTGFFFRRRKILSKHIHF